MNYSNNLTLSNCYCPSPPNELSLTDLGVFISGIILSTGGLLAIIGSQCRSSKCKEIKCGKCKILRENIEV